MKSEGVFQQVAHAILIHVAEIRRPAGVGRGSEAGKPPGF
jgi:hypothetical protein